MFAVFAFHKQSPFLQFNSNRTTTIPLYQSSATYRPFLAANINEAVMKAIDLLAAESEGTVKLISAERDGGQEGGEAACLVSITKNPTPAEKELTEGKELSAGERAEFQERERIRTTQRRFVVKLKGY